MEISKWRLILGVLAIILLIVSTRACSKKEKAIGPAETIPVAASESKVVVLEAKNDFIPPEPPWATAPPEVKKKTVKKEPGDQQNPKGAVSLM